MAKLLFSSRKQVFWRVFLLISAIIILSLAWQATTTLVYAEPITSNREHPAVNDRSRDSLEDFPTPTFSTTGEHYSVHVPVTPPRFYRVYRRERDAITVHVHPLNDIATDVSVIVKFYKVDKHRNSSGDPVFSQQYVMMGSGVAAQILLPQVLPVGYYQVHVEAVFLDPVQGNVVRQATPVDVAIIFNPPAEMDESFVNAEEAHYWTDNKSSYPSFSDTHTYQLHQRDGSVLKFAMDKIDGLTDETIASQELFKLTQFLVNWVETPTPLQKDDTIAGLASCNKNNTADPENENCVSRENGIGLTQCFDYANYLTAFLRSVGIAARPITGGKNKDNPSDRNYGVGAKDIDEYAESPDASLNFSDKVPGEEGYNKFDFNVTNWPMHVWTEIYLAGSWQVYDANQNFIGTQADYGRLWISNWANEFDQRQPPGALSSGPSGGLSADKNGGGEENLDCAYALPICTQALTKGLYHPLTKLLTWQPADGAVEYDVYLWRVNGTPTLIGSSREPEFSLQNIIPSLVGGVQYFWKVVARFESGEPIESDRWSFTHSQYPYGLVSVSTIPEIIPHKYLPGLFDDRFYPENAIINYDSAGPVAIIFEFLEPTDLTGFRMSFAGFANIFHSYSIKLEAAATLSDLNSASGSYQLIAPDAPASAGLNTINFPSGTLPAEFFKVTVDRNDYDQVVHIDEMIPLLGSNQPDSGAINGKVLGNNAPLGGAFVQACLEGGSCWVTSTNSSGRYIISSLPGGTYVVTAFPPASSNLLKNSPQSVSLAAGQSLAVGTLFLTGPIPPPPGTTITSNGTTPDGLPVVYWAEVLTLTTQGCHGGSATYSIQQGGDIFRSGGMDEATPGIFQAQVPALHPLHGPAQIETKVACSGGPTITTVFDIYIDPSGWVRDLTGAPIIGATVTLYRSEVSGGPFEVVSNGSAIMSPMNRHNPDLTNGEGHFGWDVIAGYYKVRASKAGCVSPIDFSQSYIETVVLAVPPAVFDLDLRLDCNSMTLTPTQTSTATQTLTSTLRPTETPTVTETLTPTSTAESRSTRTPRPTKTEKPTKTFTSTPTLKATRTPSPTKTSKPVNTVTPTRTATSISGSYPQTIDGLRTLLKDLHQLRLVDNEFFRSMDRVLLLAEELLQRGHREAAVVLLRGFRQVTQDQNGHVTPKAEQQLIDLTQKIIDNLR